MDLTSGDSVRRAILEAQPDAVIHSAAISRIDVCEKDPERSYQVNVTGAVNVAKACAAAGARLVFFSSDQVYSGCGGREPLPEDAPLSPTNVYARHKLEAEGRVLEICPDACALRLSWMYDMPHRGLYTGNNLYTAALRALCTGQPIMANPNDRRGITCVRQVVDQLPLMLQAPGGVYNYGSLTRLSAYQVYREIFALLGAGSRAEELVQPFHGNPRNLLMDPARAEAVGVRFPETVEGFRVMLQEYGMA
jgi:dTDP-4-dehydrorhamnose reductase